MNVENCWILPGGTDGRLWWGYLRRRTTGSICQVAFDAAYVLKREEEKGDIVGFFHTHPCGAYPSGRDDVTMKQWVMCFGKPLVCVIKGTDGIRAWFYMDDESEPVLGKTIKVFGGLIVGIIPKKPEKEPPKVERTKKLSPETVQTIMDGCIDNGSGPEDDIPTNEFIEQLL